MRPGKPAASRVRERLDEPLKLVCAPALEGRAMLLVAGDHGIAVVPVEARLRVQPEGATRQRSDGSEHVLTGRAPVGARVAEHDHGRAGVKLGFYQRQELTPDPAVI